MPQIAAVCLVGGVRDDGGIGTQEEPAGFRRKTIALRVLRDSGLVKRKGQCKCPHYLHNGDTKLPAILDCAACPTWEALPRFGSVNSEDLHHIVYTQTRTFPAEERFGLVMAHPHRSLA